MVRTTDGSTRPPAVAGRFYPGDAEKCVRQARELFEPHRAKNEQAPSAGVGGLLPHAGWIASGSIAAQTLATLAVAVQPEVVVVFGAVHTPGDVNEWASLDTYEAWETPGAQTEVARDIRSQLGKTDGLFVMNDLLHRDEHAVEVEIPLIREVWPNAKLLPIEVPVNRFAVDVGKTTARCLTDKGFRAVYLASSDLTHYGPAYRFVPAGVGQQGVAWAKRNDQRVLKLITEMNAEGVVPEVCNNYNACGGGAIAAMIAACREAGATRAQLLRHANSVETLADVAPQPPTNAVGYASVVLG